MAEDVSVITTGMLVLVTAGGDGGDGDDQGLVDEGSRGHAWGCHCWRWVMVAEFVTHGGDGGDGDVVVAGKLLVWWTMMVAEPRSLVIVGLLGPVTQRRLLT